MCWHKYLYLPASTLCIFPGLHKILPKPIPMVYKSFKWLLFLLKLFTRRKVLRKYTGMLFFFRMSRLGLGRCSCATRKQMTQRVKHTTNFIALFRWRQTHFVQWVEFFVTYIERNMFVGVLKLVINLGLQNYFKCLIFFYAKQNLNLSMSTILIFLLVVELF